MSNENYENMGNSENMNSNEIMNSNENVGSGNNDFYAPPVQDMQPSKPKKKKWPVVVAVAGAAAVVGAGVGSYFAFFNKPSFDTPTEALSTCMGQLDEQFSSDNLCMSQLQKKLGSSELMKNYKEKGQSVDVTLTLEDSDIEGLSMLNGIDIGFSYENDVKKSAATLGINGSIMGIGADASLYMDKEMLALTSEEFLPDTYISADLEDLLKLLAESEGISEEKLSSAMSVLGQSGAVQEALTDYVSYALEQLPESLQAFVEEADATEGDTDSLKIGEEEYRCYSYEVSVGAKDMKGFLEDYCSYLSEYDYDSNEFFSYVAQSVDTQSEERDIDTFMKEALEMIPDAVDEDSGEMLDLTVYISKKAQLLGMDMEMEADSGNTSVELRFGGENPGQDVYLDVTGEGEDSAIQMSLVSANVTEDDVETALVAFQMEADDTKVDVKVESNYNTKEDDFDCLVQAAVDAQGKTVDAEITAKGQYDEIKSGEGFKMSFDDITINLDTDGLDELKIPFTTISVSMELECKVLEEEVVKPSGTGYDLFELTKEDAYKILDVMKESKTFSYIMQAVSEDDINKVVEGLFEELQKVK